MIPKASPGFLGMNSLLDTLGPRGIQSYSPAAPAMDLIYTWGTLAHTTGKNPFGLNVLWGDGHVKFSTTRAAFATKLWGGTGGKPTSETPGDNPAKFRTIVSLMRP